MITLKLKVDPNRPDQEVVAEAARILKRGGLVGMPTETVYGLAANALDENAVKNVFVAKGRPQDNPLIVHISDIEMMIPLVTEFKENAKKCADAFWPGPFTMILPKSDVIPSSVCAGLNSVAIRMPSDPTAHLLIKLSGVPIAAPSANISGLPSPTTAERVVEDMDGKIDAVLMAGPCSVGVESTVVTFCGEHPRLLRPGGVTLEQLKEILPDIEVDSAVLEKIDANKPVASPGMKYKHYSPGCEVTLVKGSSEDFIKYVNENKGDKTCVLCFEEDKNGIESDCIVYGSKGDGKCQAASLFDDLRKLDDKGYKICYAHAPELDGVGLAVYNRLIRAAAFKVVIL